MKYYLVVCKSLCYNIINMCKEASALKFKWDKKYFYWGVTAFLVVLASIVVFVMAFNFKASSIFFKKMFAILTPFSIGLVMAYVLCPIMIAFEQKLFLPLLKNRKIKKVNRVCRVLSLISTIIFAILVISALFSMILPQLITSIMQIVENFQTYFNNFNKWLSTVVNDNPLFQQFISNEFYDIGGVMFEWVKANILPQANNIIQGFTTGVLDAFNILKDALVGIIVAVYVLFAKEKFSAQIKKLLYAFFPLSKANRCIEITLRSHKIFSGFIVGKIIDSIIIGILCFMGMTLFKMPFPLLISVIIGITNIIPFFGPFIGAIPSAFLILLVDPMYCFYFILFILALQQLDGNVIGPKILGDSTGLAPIWVIFAILLGGGLFGFGGMIIGVPAFAVIYSLITDLVHNRLNKRNLPTSTGDYYKIQRIEATTKPTEDESLPSDT